MSDNYLIQEARAWYGHGDLQTLTGNLLTRLADALEAANARANRLEQAWKRDNLCGICPYRKAVQAENDRLHAALSGVPAEPATEEKP